MARKGPPSKRLPDIEVFAACKRLSIPLAELHRPVVRKHVEDYIRAVKKIMADPFPCGLPPEKKGPGSVGPSRYANSRLPEHKQPQTTTPTVLRQANTGNRGKRS